MKELVLFLIATLFLTVLSERFPSAYYYPNTGSSNYYSPSPFGNNYYPAAAYHNPYAEYYVRSIINHPAQLPPSAALQTSPFYYPPYHYGQQNDKQIITNSDQEDLKHLEALKANYDLENSNVLSPSMGPVSPFYRSGISSSFSSFLSSYFNLSLQTFTSTKLLIFPSFG